MHPLRGRCNPEGCLFQRTLPKGLPALADGRAGDVHHASESRVPPLHLLHVGRQGVLTEVKLKKRDGASPKSRPFRPDFALESTSPLLHLLPVAGRLVSSFPCARSSPAAVSRSGRPCGMFAQSAAVPSRGVFPSISDSDGHVVLRGLAGVVPDAAGARGEPWQAEGRPSPSSRG